MNFFLMGLFKIYNVFYIYLRPGGNSLPIQINNYLFNYTKMRNNYFFNTTVFLTFTLLVSTLIPTGSKADTLNVSSSITPEQMVQDILIGGGVVTSNITYSGASMSRGKFCGGPGNIGIENGILLTSGNVTIAPGPNNNDGAGSNSGQGGDPDLTDIANVSTFDACVLEFDFIPQSTIVSFRYVFGSEEYHEYVDQFNDAFGFFISGPGISGPYSNNSKNIALIPLTDIPVTINTVNCGNPYNCFENCDACQFFVNNTHHFTQYDAFTKVLSAWATVIPCETYHIKLAIADGADHNFDSGVFLEAGSFSSVGISNQLVYNEQDFDYLIEGCNNTQIKFQLSILPDADFYLPLTISGTAINGVDYHEIPDSVYFQQGHSQASFDIISIADNLTEWFENIRIVYNSSLCSIDYDTIIIALKDYQLSLDMTPDTTINCATEAHIGVENINGFEPFTLIWSTGDTTPYITVSPLITTTYYLTCAALCDSMTTDSVTVYVNGPETNAGEDQSIPYGTTTILQGSAGQGSGDYTYSWEPAALLSDPTSPTPITNEMEATTQFTLTITDLAGGCQDVDQVMVFVTGGPLNVGPTASPNAICPGETAQLFSYAAGGSENYSFTWTSSPAGFSSDLPNPVVQPYMTTTYHVLVNDGYNVVDASVTVTVHVLPVAEAGENDTIWYGTYGHLFGDAYMGSGTYSWFWEPADKLINPYAQNPVTKQLTETTLFRLTVSDNETGCDSQFEDLVTVVVKGGALMVAADVTDAMICTGTSTQLHALPSGGNPEYTFNWTSDPPGFTSIEQDPVIWPEDNAYYTVEVYDGYNYFTSAPVHVSVSDPPAVSLGADLFRCPYDTVTLTATPGAGWNYYWSNGSIDQSVMVVTTGIGFDIKTIWVEVENADGCMNTDTIRVIFDFATCTGIEENDAETNVMIYPNPSDGKFNIEWNGLSGHVEMQITDIHGNIVIENKVLVPISGEYKDVLNLSGHPDGIYLLRLVSDERVVVRKMILN